jgi:hypothetical protein
MNSKGVSLTTGLVYGLVSLFGLTILYIVIVEFAIVGQVLPLFQNFLLSGGFALTEGVKNEVSNNWNRIIFTLRLIPAVLFFVVIIFMFILGIRKEQEAQYYG